jgi:hypothetical protein
MRLNHDLAREILQKIGELPFDGNFHEIQIEGHSGEEITYHVMQLANAGLIEAVDLSTFDGICWRPKHLTYAGEEFLAAAESNAVWDKAKSIGGPETRIACCDEDADPRSPLISCRRAHATICGKAGLS